MALCSSVLEVVAEDQMKGAQYCVGAWRSSNKRLKGERRMEETVENFVLGVGVPGVICRALADVLSIDEGNVASFFVLAKPKSN